MIKGEYSESRVNLGFCQWKIPSEIISDMTLLISSILTGYIFLSIHVCMKTLNQKGKLTDYREKKTCTKATMRDINRKLRSVQCLEVLIISELLLTKGE